MEDQEEGSTADGWTVRERGRGAGRKEVFGAALRSRFYSERCGKPQRVLSRRVTVSDLCLSNPLWLPQGENGLEWQGKEGLVGRGV